MMDGTDRHCRYFHRLMTKHARLYSEMITPRAIIHGDRDYLLGFGRSEHPVALQLGGSVPDELTAASKIGEDYGYDEINLNVGCPSDRVQSGAFGACLMKSPDLVARSVAAMAEAVSLPVTVKCRIGVDAQNPQEILPQFIKTVAEAGCKTFIIHARMAWLQGLSPKDNRTIPPLDYELVKRMKEEFPQLKIILNGGLDNVLQAKEHLAQVDGVMLGRAPYANPWLLTEVDQEFYQAGVFESRREDIAMLMHDYLEKTCTDTQTKPHAITRHMIGLFRGTRGARSWRRALSTLGSATPADIIPKALDEMKSSHYSAAS